MDGDHIAILDRVENLETLVGILTSVLIHANHQRVSVPGKVGVVMAKS